jgi:CBS-domain-containing membrane protein
VLDDEGRLIGVTTRSRLAHLQQAHGARARVPLAEALSSRTVVAGPAEPLRLVVRRMAETGLTRFPIVDEAGRFLGMIALGDLLLARVRLLEAESRRDRLLPLGPLWPAALGRLRRFARPVPEQS